jgi:polar amino acid transport system substrate-binding protein
MPTRSDRRRPSARNLALVLPALLAWVLGAPTAGAETGELRLVYVGDAAPFSSMGDSGKPEGYAVALCERIAAAVRPNAQPSWQQANIADGIDLLAGGAADLLCGPVTITLDREAKVDFTSPIAVGGIGAIIRPGAPAWFIRMLHIGEPDQVSPRGQLAKLDWPKRVAVLERGTAAEWLAGAIQRDRIDVRAVPVTGYDDAAVKLSKGEVGAWIGEWAVLAERARMDPRLKQMTLVPRPIVGEPLSIPIRRDDGLARAVKAALYAFLRGPELEPLAVKWFGPAGRVQAPLIQSVTPKTGAGS